MTNITALLLVLTMTGTPVASVVCVTECQHELMTSGHCHDDMATSSPLVSAGVSCTDPSIGGSPFVIEHRAAPGAAVLAANSWVTPTLPVRTDAPVVIARAADAWLAPPLVLRL